MKNLQLMISAAIVVAGFTACSDSKEKETAKMEAASLTQYVDSIDQVKPIYTVENWTMIDNAYQERALRAETHLAMLEAEDKANAEASKAKYAALKATYEAKLKENEKAALIVNEKPDYRQVLRNRLFGEGKIGSDMQFKFATADNLKGIYENFVNTIADNKNNFTREDWDEIKVLYEALDTRKNAVEKDLSTADNLKIAGLKIRFASIKATHRGGTKAEENHEAKQ